MTASRGVKSVIIHHVLAKPGDQYLTSTLKPVFESLSFFITYLFPMFLSYLSSSTSLVFDTKLTPGFQKRQKREKQASAIYLKKKRGHIVQIDFNSALKCIFLREIEN